MPLKSVGTTTNRRTRFMAKAKSKEAGPTAHIPAYNVLNVREPELFARLFAAAKKRKLPRMSLTALFRDLIAPEWLEYQERNAK